MVRLQGVGMVGGTAVWWFVPNVGPDRLSCGHLAARGYTVLDSRRGARRCVGCGGGA